MKRRWAMPLSLAAMSLMTVSTAMAGNFSHTCRDISIDGGQLSAICRTQDQRERNTAINLDRFIGNIDGRLTWGERNFSHSSRDIYVWQQIGSDMPGHGRQRAPEQPQSGQSDQQYKRQVDVRQLKAKRTIEIQRRTTPCGVGFDMPLTRTWRCIKNYARSPLPPHMIPPSRFQPASRLVFTLRQWNGRSARPGLASHEVMTVARNSFRSWPIWMGRGEEMSGGLPSSSIPGGSNGFQRYERKERKSHPIAIIRVRGMAL